MNKQGWIDEYKFYIFCLKLPRIYRFPRLQFWWHCFRFRIPIDISFRFGIPIDIKRAQCGHGQSWTTYYIYWPTCVDCVDIESFDKADKKLGWSHLMGSLWDIERRVNYDRRRVHPSANQ